jgi:hypothetical protein
MSVCVVQVFFYKPHLPPLAQSLRGGTNKTRRAPLTTTHTHTQTRRYFGSGPLWKCGRQGPSITSPPKNLSGPIDAASPCPADADLE